MIFWMLALLAVAAEVALITRPPNPTIITLSETLVLVQCTPKAFAFVRNGCDEFNPRHPDCAGRNKYTWTMVGKCTPELVDFIKKMKDFLIKDSAKFKLRKI